MPSRPLSDPSRLAPEEFRAITQQVGLPVGVLTVGVMTVGVLTVGVLTVGAMTVGVLTVGSMGRPRFCVSENTSCINTAHTYTRHFSCLNLQYVKKTLINAIQKSKISVLLC